MDFYTMFAPIQPTLRHEELGLFDFEATTQEDGTVEVYILWADDNPGLLFYVQNEVEAREFLAFLIKYETGVNPIF